MVVSVVMPLYNCEEYVKDAVDSILNQSFRDFELIIIDDNSQDDTFSIVEQFKDQRIKKYKTEKNVGAAGAINKGLEVCSGELIAVMHGDDIALSNRLELQVNFFTKEPKVDILGTQCKLISSAGSLLNKKPSSFPTTIDLVKYSLLFDNVLCHPTVMFRRKIIDEYQLKYNPKYRSVEDYDFWTQSALKGAGIANLNEVCLYYRIHDSQVSVTQSTQMHKDLVDVRNNYRLNFRPIISDLIVRIENLSDCDMDIIINDIRTRPLTNGVRRMLYAIVSQKLHISLKEKRLTNFSLKDYFFFLKSTGWSNLNLPVLYRILT